MRASVIAVALAVLGAAAAVAQVADLVDRSAFRVCADPALRPLSADDGSGFENRIAELIAESLGVPVEYTWFPQVIGFVRQTLSAGKCDVVMGYAQGDELVLNTNHYYTSTHVIVVRSDGDLADVDSLADPRLQGRRIGVVAGAPPATHVARLGLMKDAKPYDLMMDRRVESPADAMLADVETGKIDAALLWGPIGGPLVKARAPIRGDAAPQGAGAATAGLPDHHGRSCRRGLSGSATSTARSGGTRTTSTRSSAMRACRSSTTSARARSRSRADRTWETRVNWLTAERPQT